MADDLNPVQPGDLITSALINKIIQRLQGGVATATGTSVPNLFGMTLGQASALLQTATSGLQLGGILDVFGTSITPTDPSKTPFLVVGQSPSTGVFVPSGTAISLVIAGPSATTTPKVPTITGISPTTQSVGLGLEIDGQFFDPLAGNNTVTINGIKTTTPASNSTPATLFVTIPPGADAAPQPTTVKVTTVSGGASNAFNVNVTASTGAQQATITSFSGASVQVAGKLALVTTDPTSGATIVVTGTNFGSATASVKFYLGNPSVANVPFIVPSTVTPTSMTVQIPPVSKIIPSATNTNPVVQIGTVNGVASPITLQIQ